MFQKEKQENSIKVNELKVLENTEHKKKRKPLNIESVLDSKTEKLTKSVNSESLLPLFVQQQHQLTSLRTNSSTGESSDTNNVSPSGYHLQLPDATALLTPALPAAAAAAAVPYNTAAGHSLPHPASPLPDSDSNSMSHVDVETINEDSILVVESNGTKVELVLNSLLCYASKALTLGIKVKQLTDLLLNYFKSQTIDSAWNLARSLLKKKQRPQRELANYKFSAAQKI